MLACNYIVSSVEGSSCKEAGVSLNLIVDDGKLSQVYVQNRHAYNYVTLSNLNNSYVYCQYYTYMYFYTCTVVQCSSTFLAISLVVQFLNASWSCATTGFPEPWLLALCMCM